MQISHGLLADMNRMLRNQIFPVSVKTNMCKNYQAQFDPLFRTSPLFASTLSPLSVWLICSSVMQNF